MGDVVDTVIFKLYIHWRNDGHIGSNPFDPSCIGLDYDDTAVSVDLQNVRSIDRLTLELSALEHE